MVDSTLFETTIITGQLQSSEPHLSWRLDYLCHQWAALSPDRAFTVEYNQSSYSQTRTHTHSCTHAFPIPSFSFVKLIYWWNREQLCFAFGHTWNIPPSLGIPWTWKALNHRKARVCVSVCVKFQEKILKAESSSKRKRKSNQFPGFLLLLQTAKQQLQPRNASGSAYILPSLTTLLSCLMSSIRCHTKFMMSLWPQKPSTMRQ